MPPVSQEVLTLSPVSLLARIAGGEAVTILDLRDDDWTIEGPAVTVRRVAAADALAAPEELAAQLPPDVVTLCQRGVTALRVTTALRAAGSRACALEGGMREWIGTLRAVAVDVGLSGVEVRQVQRPGRGCLSYVVSAGGSALVVDPAPDAGFYAVLADELNASITDVVDTHLHADHLSGARALAALTGARLRLPVGALERGIAYPEAVTPLHDGDSFLIGELLLRAIHLPGHTTDMTGLVVGDRALIAGDSLFTHGIARPALQVGDPEGSRAMARELHRTIHERVLALGEDVVLLPCHDHPVVRAGAVTATLGEVRRDVPELAIADPDEFARELVAAMPPRPANYEAVIAVNAGRQPFDPDLERGGNSCATR